MKKFDFVVIGGGIVGLATAMQLLNKRPHLKVAVLEKESIVAKHQTGNNSGVIHSGIYYKPGSLKAKNCVAGAKEMIDFCNENQITYQLCGKVIVALDREEIPRLDELEKRGKANGVPGLERIGPERLREIEPNAIGLQGLYSPQTGIIDFKKVAQTYARKITENDGEIFLDQRVKKIIQKSDAVTIITDNAEYAAKASVNCAGLYADRIAQIAGITNFSCRIIPFRGEYYDLIPEKNHLVKGLIYPIPDPRFPFLGVHITRMIGGKVEAGPNAVLALSREGYTKRKINIKDCVDILSYKGFWNMAMRYWRMGMYEVYRSFSKKAFIQDVQKLFPCVQESDFVPGNAGVRAQVITRDGKLADDFIIETQQRMIHILSAPSPAATASLSIGRSVSDMAINRFNL
jgi:L-2-hydroxyglutarate oxidase LhgO